MVWAEPGKLPSWGPDRGGGGGGCCGPPRFAAILNVLESPFEDAVMISHSHSFVMNDQAASR